MEFKPHDTLAKTVIMQLGVGREMIPESELRIASYGDVVLRPGPAFPPFTGMLGELVGTGLVLMEFYASRPSVMGRIRSRRWTLCGGRVQKRSASWEP
ncbi:MAG: hypothetical protein ACKO6N_15190 [Myxococcota bacterium]